MESSLSPKLPKVDRSNIEWLYTFKFELTPIFRQVAVENKNTFGAASARVPFAEDTPSSLGLQGSGEGALGSWSGARLRRRRSARRARA